MGTPVFGTQKISNPKIWLPNFGDTTPKIKPLTFANAKFGTLKFWNQKFEPRKFGPENSAH